MELQNLSIQLTTDTNSLSKVFCITAKANRKAKFALITSSLNTYDQLFNRYLLSMVYMLITILGPRDRVVNSKAKPLLLWNIHSIGEAGLTASKQVIM